MTSSPPSDAGLVNSALDGDVTSLSTLLDRYRASLYARALACLGQPEDAADAVQETFLLALTRLGQVRDPEAIGGWLHAVMRSVTASGLVLRGQDQIRAMCEQDLDDGIRTRLVDVVSSAAITVIESKFVNPSDDPQHCPPAVTQVLFHDGTDQVGRALGYFQPRPAPKQA